MVEVIDHVEPLAPSVYLVADCVVLAHPLAQRKDLDVLHMDHVLGALR